MGRAGGSQQLFQQPLAIRTEQCDYNSTWGRGMNSRKSLKEIPYNLFPGLSSFTGPLVQQRPSGDPFPVSPPLVPGRIQRNRRWWHDMQVHTQRREGSLTSSSLLWALGHHACGLRWCCELHAVIAAAHSDEAPMEIHSPERAPHAIVRETQAARSGF